MNKQEILETTKHWIIDMFKNPVAGHDFEHINRVVKTAEKIHFIEGGSLFIIKMAAWLHDVDDYKIQKNNTTHAQNYLASLPIDFESQKAILNAVQSVGFRGGLGQMPQSIEAKIVQDADRIDAIGAIGIARCFAFGGFKNHPLYVPNTVANTYHNLNDYHSKTSPSSIHHFHEKLLKLKDIMHTNTAKKMANKRHAFMLKFLHQFDEEWH